MDAYSGFAKVYDKFMDNVPYEMWDRYLCRIFAKYGMKKGLLLELGCGTGSMTERMAARGYDMIGIDSSADMLAEALEKRDRSGHDILYLQQDMRSFELFGTVAGVYSICDSLNYLTEPEELTACFKLVNLYLDPGGLFIFDFTTRAEYLRPLRRIPRVEEKGRDTLIWENEFDRRSGLNYHHVTVFSGQEGETYRKEEEAHVQRAYSLRQIRRALRRAGLKYRKAYAAGTGRRPGPFTTRIFVVAEECGKA